MQLGAGLIGWGGKMQWVSDRREAARLDGVEKRRGSPDRFEKQWGGEEGVAKLKLRGWGMGCCREEEGPTWGREWSR